MIDVSYSLALLGIMTGVIILTRFLPFWIFSKGAPEPVVYLGKVLPSAIMGMLVVYCLKDMTFLAAPYGAAEVLGVLIVVAVHKWRHNTMLTLLIGTVAYMVMVQCIF